MIIMRPIVVRGGGDLATGTILALSKAGYPVIILEQERPTAIRRNVAFCDAIYERDRWYGEGTKTVEGVTCTLTSNVDDALRRAQPGRPMLMIDPELKNLDRLRPDILVDAIMAKENLGTKIDMAPLTIALGPGFTAGVDVRCVIETKRGHDLGRIYFTGRAADDSGVPGKLSGYGEERVIHALSDGVLTCLSDIGEVVEKGKVIAVIETGKNRVKVPASLGGVIRGMLPEGFEVTKGLKMADIDPRTDNLDKCSTVSDKSRCIGGSVLQLVVAYEKGLL
jgi:xanthine dehydrogenase accessory factor